MMKIKLKKWEKNCRCSATPQMLVVAFTALTGCATQNIAHLSLGYAQNPGKISDSLVFRASGLALAAAVRPIPGTIPNGVDIGIAASQLLVSNNDALLNINKQNHLEVWMPLTEAIDEDDAQLKMSAFVEKAILNALPPPYQSKVIEHDDVSVIGVVSRFREIRVNGPGCELWSCQAYGPIPTRSAMQWSGKMTTFNSGIALGTVYAYSGLQNIGFSKITREYDKEGLFAGHWHRVEGGPVPNFDYELFFQSISRNLPEWAFYYIAPKSKDNPLDGPALLSKGEKKHF